MTVPDAYERLVDRLLESPHYGERWGQFWLNAAGYSDSEGIKEEDRIRPDAWRYRDYVIRSFNSDKPYDQFLIEQIAGDELVDYKHVKEVTPALIDKLAATGFLRMVPDPTYSPSNSSIPERMNVIADEIEVLGSSVMGLTVGCARCHNHKYDPIPQRDYYQLGAILQTAYDPYDWLIPSEDNLGNMKFSNRISTSHLKANGRRQPDSTLRSRPRSSAWKPLRKSERNLFESNCWKKGWRRSRQSVRDDLKAIVDHSGRETQRRAEISGRQVSGHFEDHACGPGEAVRRVQCRNQEESESNRREQTASCAQSR